MIPDGLYRCTKGGVVAGVVVEHGLVVRHAPVLKWYCVDLRGAGTVLRTMRAYGWCVERITA